MNAREVVLEQAREKDRVIEIDELCDDVVRTHRLPDDTIAPQDHAGEWCADLEPRRGATPAADARECLPRRRDVCVEHVRFRASTLEILSGGRPCFEQLRQSLDALVRGVGARARRAELGPNACDLPRLDRCEYVTCGNALPLLEFHLDEASGHAHRDLGHPVGIRRDFAGQLDGGGKCGHLHRCDLQSGVGRDALGDRDALRRVRLLDGLRLCLVARRRVTAARRQTEDRYDASHGRTSIVVANASAAQASTSASRASRNAIRDEIRSRCVVVNSTKSRPPFENAS